MLAELVATLQASLGLQQKQDIQAAAQRLGPWTLDVTSQRPIRLGDDCAAIPDEAGYLLLATEGLWPVLVEQDPWFAGWCAVMVNVNDVYAMGGHPTALVDALWTRCLEGSHPLWEGMLQASRSFHVPIVGGHSNCHSPYDALSVAILGKAQRLLTSFDAQVGDALLLAIDLRGQFYRHYPFWDAATKADPVRLRTNLQLLPLLAEQGLCRAGKDISMGGVIGTTLMLLETSGVGANLDLAAIPRPAQVSLERWLVSFPSYGFLLSVCPDAVPQVQSLFHRQTLSCAVIGQVVADRTLTLTWAGESQPFWSLAQAALTGFTRPPRANYSCWPTAQVDNNHGS